MSCSSHFINNLYKSKKILLEILEERGYDISQQNNFTENEIRIMCNEKQLDFDVSNSDDTKKVYIRYLVYSKIRNNSLKNYINDFLELNPDFDAEKCELIIILKDKPNDSLLKVVDDFYMGNKVYINLLYIKMLLFNLLNHEYVPEHKKITEEEFKELKKTFNLNSRYQLPIISRHDAVSTILGIRPGEIVKILRPSLTSGQYKTYRCCK